MQYQKFYLYRIQFFKETVSRVSDSVSRNYAESVNQSDDK